MDYKTKAQKIDELKKEKRKGTTKANLHRGKKSMNVVFIDLEEKKLCDNVL